MLDISVNSKYSDEKYSKQRSRTDISIINQDNFEHLASKHKKHEFQFSDRCENDYMYSAHGL